MKKSTKSPKGDSTFEKTAVRVSNVSVLGNAALTAFKLAAGVIAHSGAMISDATHSASDVLASLIVIVGVKLAGKDSDAEHPYGHDRFESVAAIVLAVILLITGVFIGHTALEKLTQEQAVPLQRPGLLALVAAAVSIVTKEAMYWYTRFFAKRIHSGALMAEAWHHRSDALSSVGALIGIWGARRGLPWLDPAASLLICLMIAKAAFDIFRDATQKMVDHACSEEMQQQLLDCVRRQPGVAGVDCLQTREFGSRAFVDLEIRADGTLSLLEGSRIAERVHDRIEAQFPTVKHITVRVNPSPEEG